MKKKSLILIITVVCALLMTSCSGGGSGVSGLDTRKETLSLFQKQDSQEDVEADADIAAEPDEQEIQETDDKDTQIAQEPDEGSDNVENENIETTETGEIGTEAIETVETIETVSDMPSELSENLYDYQISIDEIVYSIPIWFSDLEALGWKYYGDSTDTLSPNQYTNSQQWKKNGISIYTRFANLSEDAVNISDSMVAGIIIEKSDLSDNDCEILLPGGIQLGVSNADDVREAYEEPSFIYDGTKYYKMTYRYDLYSEINLYIYKDTGVLEQIEIMNLTRQKEAD